MVKVSDLGYASKNLEKLPNKEQKKDLAMQRALSNLTSVQPPPRLDNSLPLPGSLLGKE